MPLRSSLLAVALVALASPALAQEAPVAGRVKVATGTAVIVRAGAEMPAVVGQDVLESDSLRTGADGSLGVTLKDDTRLSLGPGSEINLETFRYAPADRNLSLAVRFVKGVAGYVSGRIAKLAPDAVRLQTPAAIVGVRGTTLMIQVVSE